MPRIIAEAKSILQLVVPWSTKLSTQLGVYKTNYKGSRGRIGIVGGARDYAGAPYFASIASMRLGCDLAYVICSQAASPVIKSYSPDLIVNPLLDCQDDQVFEKEMDCLLSRLHALVVGPGLGLDAFLHNRAKMLVEKARDLKIPLVLDADALMLVMNEPSLIKSYEKALLTPNRVELQRMMNAFFAPKTFETKGAPPQTIEEMVNMCSSYLGVPVLSKGLNDFICDKAHNYTLKTDSSTGSDRRCGGQGDILSGLAGTYMHWIHAANNTLPDHERIENATCWAGYLAAITARICNEEAFKESGHGMLTSDMINKIPKALRILTDSGKIGQQSSKNLFKYAGSLTSDEIRRYGRQMIMDEFGPARQLNLKKASAIIIGAGGLGCPSSVYLAAGGIGRLAIVDDDVVEASNLHRQVLHTMDRVGMRKVDSIEIALKAINPNVIVDKFCFRLTRHNAVKTIEAYDVVIDATDNLISRYMISDACVVAKKPLVSGAALKMDGQLTIYNYDAETPCFRCLFPEPPPMNAVGSCADNGVLGVVPGVIGVQQALEALKICAGLRPAYAGKMLLFDGQLGLFRHVVLGKRKPECAACGASSKLNKDLIDYDDFCGNVKCSTAQSGAGSTNILDSDERVSVEQYRDILVSKQPHVLIDVRPKAHSEVSRLANAIALPLVELINQEDQSLRIIIAEATKNNTDQIFVVCRRGIASQRGTRAIQDLLDSCADLKDRTFVVKDIIGGMTAWSKQIDPEYACV